MRQGNKKCRTFFMVETLFKTINAVANCRIIVANYFMSLRSFWKGLHIFKSLFNTVIRVAKYRRMPLKSLSGTCKYRERSKRYRSAFGALKSCKQSSMFLKPLHVSTIYHKIWKNIQKFFKSDKTLQRIVQFLRAGRTVVRRKNVLTHFTAV